MELLLNRFRNLTVLLLAILAQLVLLAYQVKSNGEVRLIRVWAVTAVTPLARAIEAGRSGCAHFLSDYFVLLDVREDNKRMANGNQVDRIVALAMNSAKSAEFCGYWQRHVKAAA